MVLSREGGGRGAGNTPSRKGDTRKKREFGCEQKTGQWQVEQGCRATPQTDGRAGPRRRRDARGGPHLSRQPVGGTALGRTCQRTTTRSRRLDKSADTSGPCAEQNGCRG